AIGFVGLTIPGGFAEYVSAPARHCFRVPAGVDLATAALSEPLGVAVHGVRLSGLEIGQRVAVLGAGTIGLAAVVAARAGGAGASADFDIVLDILRRQGRRIAETLITHRFPLADIGRAFATAADKTTGSIKVTIEA